MIKYILILLIIVYIFSSTREHYYDLNYLKKKYILQKNKIGYFIDHNKKDSKFIKFVEQFAINLTKNSKLVYNTIVQYDNPNNLINDTIRENNTNFMIIDEITIHNSFFKFFKDTDYQKIRYVSAIANQYIFPIVNINNTIGSFYDIKSIGIIANSVRNNYIVKNLINIINYKNNNKIKINHYENYHNMFNSLNNFESDVVLYIDNFPNKIIKSLFFKNKNFAILNGDLNKKLIKEIYQFYFPVTFDLNLIPNYLPRKVINNTYTYFKPDITIYSFKISVYSYIKTDFDLIYNLKHYISKILHKNSTDNVKYNNTNVYNNFSMFFLNHPAVNKYLEKVGTITYNKNPECIGVWGKCTKDKLNLLQQFIF